MGAPRQRGEQPPDAASVHGLRKVAIALSALLAMAMVAGCGDTGWYLNARNEAESSVLVRVRSLGETFVYRLPASFDGRVREDTWERDATLELLADDCTVVASTDLPKTGSVLAVISSELEIDSESVPFRPVADDYETPTLESSCSSVGVQSSNG